jgi:DNA-binding IscR family transcriptional regulator
VLQALVHEGIFNGIRGPRGGYELARERRRISVADVLRAAGNDEDEQGPKSSHILDEIVLPALADAERAFTVALAQLSIEDLARRAESLRDR